MKRSEVPEHLKSGYFWRYLRGGVWLYSMFGWTRLTKPNGIKTAFGLSDFCHIEDHRYFKKDKYDKI